jgi:hypothetical protein
MNTRLRNKAGLPTAAGQDFLAGLLAALNMIIVNAANGGKQQALLLAGLLLASTLATAGELPARESEAGAPAQRWSTPENDLHLSFGRNVSTHVVCPHLPGSDHQPFCREFTADLLSVCGHRAALQLVLANGEVHRVNEALIGIDGSFEPAHRPDQPLDLASAWLPGEECDLAQESPEVVAKDTAGQLWLFDGNAWQVIRRKRLSAK